MISFLKELDQAGHVRCLIRSAPSGDGLSAHLLSLLERSSQMRRINSKQSLGRMLGDAAESAEADFALFVLDPRLIVDQSFADRMDEAIAGCQSRHGDDWLVLAPEGQARDGRLHTAVYRQPGTALLAGTNPLPVLTASEDLFVVNLRALRAMDRDERLAVHDTGTLVALGYAAGFVSLFHPRMAVGLAGEAEMPSPERLDPALEAVAGGILAERARSASVSIVVRTQFDRDHLLRRLLTSIARARRDDVPVEVVLASDVAEDRAQTAFAALRKDHRQVELRLAQPEGEDVSLPSRNRNLVAGAKAARNDYVWFIDDDDYVDIFAFQTILEADIGGTGALVFATAAIHQEVWSPREGGLDVLSATTPIDTYPARRWTRLFDGYNTVPVCGALIPREFLCRRLRDIALTHDLSEDYALFLYLLTAPGLPEIREIDTPLSHVSMRDAGDTTMNLSDRTPWIRDITSYLSDISTAAENPGLFQVLRALSNRSRNGEAEQ